MSKVYDVRTKQTYMNKWIALIIGIALLWGGASWYWYTCEINDLCRTSAEVEDIILEIEGREVAERPNDRVTGGEVRTSTRVTETTNREITRTVRCSPYLRDFIRVGENNNSGEVLKLEEFLNTYQDEDLDINGVYEEEDIMAVMDFQEKYRAQILTPWRLTEPTGNVLTTTRDQINRIHCAATAR